MTSVARAADRVVLPRAELTRAAMLVAGLGAAVALRWGAQLRFAGDGLVIGAGFGAVLFVLAAAMWDERRPVVRSRVDARLLAAPLVGLFIGFMLVALAAAIRADAMPALRPAAPFAPWVAVTVIVAGAEEALLRGALFTTADRLAGPLVALVLTSALFAAMHLPFYGLAALPLDLGVGFVLGGLRLATRGIAAPIAAHVVADLATWWL